MNAEKEKEHNWNELQKLTPINIREESFSRQR